MKNSLIGMVKEFIKVIIIVAIAVPVISIFASWTGPAGAPPTNNADAPINAGPLDQVKSGGWLSLGNLISRGTAILARDDGNVGIGTTNPTESLDAIGFVKGRVGLCIGDDCRVSWPLLSEGGIPVGYQEIFYNLGEDIYGNLVEDYSKKDTCDGFNELYECKPEESRTCTDALEADSGCDPDDEFDCFEERYRIVTCKTSKMLAQGEGLQKSTAGTATIIARDYSGNSEWCKVKINTPACNLEIRSPNPTQWSDERCEIWVEGGDVANICFPGKGLYAIWNRSGDSGPIEIFYRP